MVAVSIVFMNLKSYIRVWSYSIQWFARIESTLSNPCRYIYLSGRLILEVRILGLITPGYARKVWRNDELWLMTWHCITGCSLVYYRVVDVPVSSLVVAFHLCLSRLSLVLIRLLSSYVEWVLKGNKYRGHSCRYHSNVCTHNTIAGLWIRDTWFWSW